MGYHKPRALNLPKRVTQSTTIVAQETNMEAELKTTLPQEGTGSAGESLPMDAPACMGSPTVSGGGKVSLKVQSNATGSNKKKTVQQIFHPSLFQTRTRSPSSENKSSLNNAHTKNRPQDKLLDTIHVDTNSINQAVVDRPSWQRVPKSRLSKKRKILNSPEGVTTTNRFSELPIDLTEDVELQPKEKKPTKPPPIILYGIEDVSKLTELLETATEKSSFTYKIVNRNQIRISSNNVEVYKKLLNIVREHGLIGHTFNRKDQRACRIVIKNLHHSTPHNAIKEAIESTGNTVYGEIINAHYGSEKMPTSTFFVNLQPGPNNKAAKEIKFIYNQAVRIEEPKKRKTVVQCQRCQQYGHSKNYCLKPYRCVKCAQSHKTSECPKKDRNTPALCALCLGPHPANYKGCQVYIEILARKTAKSQNHSNKIDRNIFDMPEKYHPNSNSSSEGKNSKLNKIDRRTYADATKTHNNNFETSMNSTKNHSFEQILLQQNQKFEVLLQQMSTLMSLITTLVNKLVK